MAFSTAGLNALVTDGSTQFAYLSIHTGDPGTTGASEVTGGSYARQAITWGTASGGSRVGTQVTVPIPSGTAASHWGIRTASTAGTFLVGGALAATETFGGAGSVLHTPTLTVA